MDDSSEAVQQIADEAHEAARAAEQAIKDAELSTQRSVSPEAQERKIDG